MYVCSRYFLREILMPIITLTSDWGSSDYYTAAVKGAILSLMPDATIVDVSHDIEPFNITQAGFILRNTIHCFPEGTVHIIAVDDIESEDKPHVVVKAFGQYFISTDNGVFGFIFGHDYDEARYLDVPQDTSFFTFSARDRFAKVAVMLAQGQPLSSVGALRPNLNIAGSFQPTTTENTIEGIVIYIDSYENVITNITRELFESVRKGRPFNIVVKGNFDPITTISESYDEVPDLDPVALFGTHGYLELALNHAKMASLWGLDDRSSIQVVFLKKDEK